MSAAVTSSPVSADNDRATIARAKLVRLQRQYPAAIGKHNPKLYTICSCCGTQMMDEKGRLSLHCIGGYILSAPDKESVTNASLESVYKRWTRWGYSSKEDAKARYKKTNEDFQQYLTNNCRVGKPGITLSYSSAEDTIKALYPDDPSKIKSYEFNDPDDKAVCLVWSDA